MNRALAFAVVVIFTCTCLARAENWPQWRGIKGDGISPEKDLPIQWTRTENVAWKLELPGRGGATPVVWGERIFLTSVDEDDLVLLCINTDGKQKWRQAISSGNRNVRGDEGDSASPSPCTDGKHVWAFFADGALACCTVEGDLVWKADLQQRFGKFSIAFGLTSTPVLDKGRLYLQLIHGEGNPKTQEAKVVCLDSISGDTIWAVPRTSDGRDENEHSYASAVLYRSDKAEYLVTHGNDYTIGHSLETGEELWRLGGLNPKGTYEPTLRFVASPVAVPGFIVVPTAKGRGVYCLKGDELKGDVTNNESAFWWKRESKTPDVPSPLVHGGLVYLVRESGDLICLDAETGKEHYSKRVGAGDHRASPVFADGNLYSAARTGKVSVIQAGPELTIESVNDVGEPMTASPAISNGRIYLRTFKSLWAIGDK
jgi:outer membrane protein assembly factor BamB